MTVVEIIKKLKHKAAAPNLWPIIEEVGPNEFNVSVKDKKNYPLKVNAKLRPNGITLSNGADNLFVPTKQTDALEAAIYILMQDTETVKQRKKMWHDYQEKKKARQRNVK